MNISVNKLKQHTRILHYGVHMDNKYKRGSEWSKLRLRFIYAAATICIGKLKQSLYALKFIFVQQLLCVVDITYIIIIS